MNTRKLEPNEQAGLFEKILMLTSGINVASLQVKEVLNSRYESVAFNKSEGRDTKFIEKAVTDTEDLLKESIEKLDNIYQALLEFCNGCDAVSDVDIHFHEPILNITKDTVPTEDNVE